MKVVADMNGTTSRQVDVFDLIDVWIKAQGTELSSVRRPGRLERHDVLQQGNLTLHRTYDISKPGPNGEDLVFIQVCEVVYSGQQVFSVMSELVTTGEEGTMTFTVVTDIPGLWESLLRQRVAEIQSKT